MTAGATPIGEDRARVLYQLGCAFAARTELDDLLPLVLAECRAALGAQSASVLLLDRERGELYFPYVAQDDERAAAELRALRMPADRGVAGATLQGGRALRIDDVAADARFYTGIDRRTGLTTRAMLSAPLPGRTGPIGVIQVLNPLGNAVFADEDLAFLEGLAGSVAIAIENAQLYAELKRFAAGLEQQVADRTAELREKNTALERALEELRRMQEQLVVQQKLAALGALTAGVAHEIKNPLNFVNNFAALSIDLTGELAELLAEASSSPPHPDPLPSGRGDRRTEIDEILADLRQNVAKIREHGQRADRIVASMLEHSRGAAGERRATDLNALLDEQRALALHALRVEDPALQVTIETDYDPHLPAAQVVAENLGRVFLNLIGNALYAVRQKRKQLGDTYAPRIRLSTRGLSNRIEIRIRDNGPGIPRAALERIFEPFFTSKPTGEGTGLGLSISHDIVAGQHGGELRVESEEGEFADFIVVIPREE